MKKLIVIVGCSSSIAAPLVTEAKKQTNTKILLLGRKEINQFSDEYLHYDVRYNPPDELYEIIQNYDLIEIFWLAAIKEDTNERVIEVNLLAPIRFYDNLVNLNANGKVKYIVFSSQGDVHGGTVNPMYNASKSALSNYFTPKIVQNNQNIEIFLVKPWLFTSKMTKQSLFNCDSRRLAKNIIAKVDKNSHIIIYPNWTYFIVRTLSYLFPFHIYKLISFLKK